MRRGLRTVRLLKLRRQRRNLWRKSAYRAWAQNAGKNSRFEAWQAYRDEWVDQDGDFSEDGVVGSFYADADVIDVEAEVIEELDMAGMFAAFDAIKGDADKFLTDGRPRVDSVNEQLQEMGLPGKATREDIDRLFGQWKAQPQNLAG